MEEEQTEWCGKHTENAKQQQYKQNNNCGNFKRKNCEQNVLRTQKNR